MNEYIPIAECKNGYLYRISARNFSIAVYREEAKGFTGIREKFGNEYLDTEYHWDTGAPHGTAMPLKELELCPLEDITSSYIVENEEGEKVWRDNKELFNWLQEKEKQYYTEE